MNNNFNQINNNLANACFLQTHHRGCKTTLKEWKNCNLEHRHRGTFCTKIVYYNVHHLEKARFLETCKRG